MFSNLRSTPPLQTLVQTPPYTPLKVRRVEPITRLEGLFLQTLRHCRRAQPGTGHLTT